MKQAASGLDRMGRMGQWHHILDYWKIDGNEQQQTCLFPTRKNQCYQQTKEKCPFAKLHRFQTPPPSNSPPLRNNPEIRFRNNPGIRNAISYFRVKFFPGLWKK